MPETKVKKSDDGQDKLDIKQTISDIEKYFLPILLSLEDVELSDILLKLDGLDSTPDLSLQPPEMTMPKRSLTFLSPLTWLQPPEQLLP